MRTETTCEERARGAARNLADAVSEIGFDVKSFVDELSHQHRTLQQGVTRAFVCWMEHLSRVHSKGDG